MNFEHLNFIVLYKFDIIRNTIKRKTKSKRKNSQHLYNNNSFIILYKKNSYILQARFAGPSMQYLCVDQSQIKGEINKKGKIEFLEDILHDFSNQQ